MTAPLPRLLVLTDRRAAARQGHHLGDVLAGLAGLDLAVVLREKDLPAAERAALATRAIDAGLTVLVASDAAVARRSGAAGVHLAAADPLPAQGVGVVGRSCHDAASVAAAAAEQVDYVTVSPVHPTPSKPGYGPPLELAGLGAIARTARVPVYALGGITVPRVRACVEAGARGVAVMGAVMGASDPVAAAAGLLAALPARGEAR